MRLLVQLLMNFGPILSIAESCKIVIKDKRLTEIKVAFIG